MESFQKISDEYVKFYEKNFKNLLLHDHVEEILKSVNLLGSSQSILSAGNQGLLNNWLKSHDISQYFLHIIGVENHYANGKIKQGLRLKENLEFKNNEIVLVGDTIHDSEVAEEMGVDCILVDHGHVNTQRLIKTGRAVQSSIRSVLELIN
jgi:phosphoglycolate phosphatase